MFLAEELSTDLSIKYRVDDDAGAGKLAEELASDADMKALLKQERLRRVRWARRGPFLKLSVMLSKKGAGRARIPKALLPVKPVCSRSGPTAGAGADTGPGATTAGSLVSEIGNAAASNSAAKPKSKATTTRKRRHTASVTSAEADSDAAACPGSSSDASVGNFSQSPRRNRSRTAAASASGPRQRRRFEVSEAELQRRRSLAAMLTSDQIVRATGCNFHRTNLFLVGSFL